MEEKILTYKCPCCGGAIEFDPNLQKLKCPFCENEYEIETLNALEQEEEPSGDGDFTFSTDSGRRWEEGEGGGLSVYVCQSCGGEIIAEQTAAALFCPFCSNPVVLTENLSGDLKPDGVIPFAVDKNGAIAALKRLYKGKTLLPKVFSRKNHLEEIKGIYIPFWVFDADADAAIRCRATRSTTWSDRDYVYTRISHYLVIRAGQIGFDAVPADGSSKMDDSLSESVEPFDFSAAVDFHSAYLPGFFAERYDVSSDACMERIRNRVKNSAELEFTRTVQGYGSVVPERVSIRLTNSLARYILCPIWMLTTDFEGKKYVFAVNGQTGKAVGNLPMSKKAFWGWLAGLTGAIGGGIFLILLLIFFFG